ncbi:MAG: hypothetical protein ABIN69_18790 [Aestuariivirga sp.]
MFAKWHIADKPKVSIEAAPRDWVSLAPSRVLAIARRAHLKRLAGRCDEAREFDNTIRAMGKDANSVYAKVSNIMNIAEGPQNTTRLSAEYRAAMRGLGSQGGKDMEGVVRVQMAKREMSQSAGACRSKLRIVLGV